jgi:hypothetical protein
MTGQRRVQIEREQQQQQGTQTNQQSYNNEPLGHQDASSIERCIRCRAQGSEKTNTQKSQEAKGDKQCPLSPNSTDHPSAFEEPHAQCTSHSANSDPSTYSIPHIPLLSPCETVPPTSACLDIENLNTPNLYEDFFLDSDLGSPSYFVSGGAWNAPVKRPETVRILWTPIPLAELKSPNDQDSRKHPQSITYAPTVGCL